ncbi:hypothetical protein [Niabella soli]|uniref:Asl1-like glycosyl hydrolase catalytic domain-containing protein n=1 Tax=Niabella soli DSM 19437 TaxID=929713 RepID=W0F1Y5_9BACT|nr:hypothetical protein [Niabella soli]AHF17065.1 hypothetical protein NIASO_01090 [Niabella soli DSM 19437]
MKTNKPLLVLSLVTILLFSCHRGSGEETKGGAPAPGVPAGNDSVGPGTTVTTMDRFIGANAFIDDPVDKLAAVGFIREYHNWAWDEGDGASNYPGFPNNQIKFAPSYPGWSFDDFYQGLKQNNVQVAPCLQGSVNWLPHSGDYNSDNKPLDAIGADPTSPYSYYAKANHLYQFAARYGSVKVPDANLLLAAGQPRLSGLNYLNYIEDWNEQDKNWSGRDAEFLPEEYAAMASADYDGHCNTLNKFGKQYGIKNADPSLKLVMGGLSNVDINYIKRMKSWFEANRKDKQFAADVLNFHIYAFKDGQSWQGGGPALSPEDARFKEKLAAVVAYRDQNLPGKEVWVSEFGWDTNPQSVLAPPPIGSMDMQEIQAIWLVRAYLAFAAAGVDRAQMYMSRDYDPNNKTWFSSTGLMGPKGDFTPKKSWYYVYTLKNVLTNMHFMGSQNSTDPNVLVYKFKDVASSKGVYVVWAKTSKDYKVPGYTLSIPAAKSAQLTSLVPGSNQGTTQSLTISQGTVHFDVSEKPVFLQTDAIN